MPIHPTKEGIIVEISVKDCVVEAYLNGIPLGLCGLGSNRQFNRPVHEYLVDGKNELSLLINPGPTPAKCLEATLIGKPAKGAQPAKTAADAAFEEPEETELDREIAKLKAESAFEEEQDDESAPSPSMPDISGVSGPALGKEWYPENWVENPIGIPVKASAEAEITLARYATGASAGDDSKDIIQKLTWTPSIELPQIVLEEQPYPRWVRTQVDLGSLFGLQHWQNADKLTEKDLPAALEFIESIKNHLQDGNTDPILALSERRFIEVCNAYAMNADERKALFANVIAQEAADEEAWIFQSPEEDEISLRLVADNRMIECLDTNWEPLVKTVPDAQGQNFAYPMLIGKSGDQWILMR